MIHDLARPQRLLLLTSEFTPFRGGIGTYARELAAAAAAEGHDVTVFAPDYLGDQTERDAAEPFRVVRYRGEVATMRGLPGRILAVRRLLKRERFDVVHAIDWPFFIPVRLARGLTKGARIFLTVHGSEIIYMQEPQRRRILDLIRFWVPGWATWVSNSEYTATLLRETFPQIRAQDVIAEPLAISPGWLVDREDRSAARTALGVPDDAFVILSLGRVVPRKGHAIIAEALAQIPAEIAASMHWWVVGPLLDEAHSAKLKAMTDGQPARTDIFGPLPGEEVRRRIAAADVFCLPGYQDEGGRVEGFGIVFLEAGAFGVPAVATLSGGIPEAVEQDRTGLLVPERDPGAVADALVRLVQKPELRLALGAAARAKAEGQTWIKVARRTYDLVPTPVLERS